MHLFDLLNIAICIYFYQFEDFIYLFIYFFMIMFFIEYTIVF